MNYKAKSPFGPQKELPFKEPDQTSAEITREKPESADIVKEFPQSVDLTQELPQSVDLTQELPQSVDLAKEFPQSVDLTQEMPQSVDITKELPQSVDLTQEIPQSVDVFSEQATSVDLINEMPQSVDLVGEVPQSVNLAGEVPQSVDLVGEIPQSVDMVSEIPQSVDIAGEQSYSSEVFQELPSSQDVQREQPQSVDLVNEMPQSIVLTQEMPQSLPIHTRELKGLGLLMGSSIQEMTIDGLITDKFGHNSLSESGQFHITEAINVQSGNIKGALTNGYKNTLAATAESAEAGAATALINAVTLAQAECEMHYLAVNIRILGQTGMNLAVRIPKLVEFCTSINVTLSDGEDCKLYFPRSTILAPIRVSYGSVAHQKIVHIGPFYIPFVAEIINGQTITVTPKTGDNCYYKLDGADAFAAASGATDTSLWVALDTSPFATTVDGLQDTPGILASYGSSSIADPLLTRFIDNGSSDIPVGKAFYKKGWQYFDDTEDAKNPLGDMYFKLSTVQVGGYTETADDYDETHDVINGQGYLKLQLEDVDHGTLSGTFTSASKVSKIADQYVYFANTDLFPYNSDSITDLNTVGDEVGFYPLMWQSGTKTYARYPLKMIATSPEEVKLYAATASFDETKISARHWLSLKIGDDYHHPENLNYIYPDLPAVTAGLSITKVSELLVTTSFIALTVEYSGVVCLLIARKASSVSGGPFLVDEGEQNQWILSQYVLSDGNVMSGYYALFGHNTVGLLPLAEGIGAEGEYSNLAISTSYNEVQTRKSVSCQVLIGNRLFLDTFKNASFEMTLMYGQSKVMFVPWCIDTAVLAIKDSLVYGVKGVVVPTILPTINCANVTPSSGAYAEASYYANDEHVFATPGLVNGWHSQRGNYQSGYMDTNSTSIDVNCHPRRGSVVMFNTPSIAEGNVYSALPPQLATFAGDDFINNGIHIGKRLINMGNGGSYVAANSYLYKAGAYPLNAVINNKLVNTKGEFYAMGSMVFCYNPDSYVLTVFAQSELNGLQYLTAYPLKLLSNYAIVQNRITFVAVDGIYVFEQGRVERIYDFSVLDFTPNDAAIVASGGTSAIIYVLKTTATTNEAVFIIDSNKGIYESSNYGDDPGDMVPTIIETDTIPEVMFTLLDSGTWTARSPSLVLGTGDQDVTSNRVLMMQNGRKFILTGLHILYDNTNASAVTPYKIRIYNESSDTVAVYSEDGTTTLGVATRTKYYDHHNTGMIPCSELWYMIEDFNASTTIREIKFTGFYSPEIL